MLTALTCLLKREMTRRNTLTVSGEALNSFLTFDISGEEEEIDAMMGELTMEELKAAFRLFLDAVAFLALVLLVTHSSKPSEFQLWQGPF